MFIRALLSILFGVIYGLATWVISQVDESAVHNAIGDTIDKLYAMLVGSLAGGVLYCAMDSEGWHGAVVVIVCALIFLVMQGCAAAI